MTFSLGLISSSLYFPKNKNYVSLSLILHDRADKDEYIIDFSNLTFDFENKKEELANSTIVYISGAISGTTDYMERFEKAENKLKDEGYTVINPAKINSFLPTTTTWAVTC